MEKLDNILMNIMWFFAALLLPAVIVISCFIPELTLPIQIASLAYMACVGVNKLTELLNRRNTK